MPYTASIPRQQDAKIKGHEKLLSAACFTLFFHYCSRWLQKGYNLQCYNQGQVRFLSMEINVFYVPHKATESMSLRMIQPCGHLERLHTLMTQSHMRVNYWSFWDTHLCPKQGLRVLQGWYPPSSRRCYQGKALNFSNSLSVTAFPDQMK